MPTTNHKLRTISFSLAAKKDSRDTHISLRKVSKYFGARTNKRVHALCDIDLDIGRHEFISLVGPSGCGKSTILKLLAGLSQATDGSIETLQSFGNLVDADTVGYVFQSPVLLPWKSVLSNVLLPATLRGAKRKEALCDVRRLLEMTGLLDFEASFPYQLSGGMQQRAAICRALMCKGDLLLMDEPFGALDALTRDDLMVDVKRLCKTNPRTVVFVTHNITEAVFLSDRVVVLSPRPGRISEIFDVPRFSTSDLSVIETHEFQQIVAAIRRRIEADRTSSSSS